MCPNINSRQIRDEFKNDEYVLNIIVSGNSDFKNDLKNFLIPQHNFHCCGIISVKINNNERV